MKEVTYENWQKNPTPRMMWVWDKDEELKVKRKVIYVLKRGHCMYPVRVTTNDDTGYEVYIHCAEIGKQRRMTNKELSRWLSEKPHRERKDVKSSYIYTYYTYSENEQDKEVPGNFLIRENDSEWREPLVEVEK